MFKNLCTHDVDPKKNPPKKKKNVRSTRRPFSSEVTKIIFLGTTISAFPSLLDENVLAFLVIASLRTAV